MELVRLHRGRPMRRDKCISAVPRDVTIASEEEWSYTIDGDLYKGVKELTLATGPLLQLLVPELR
jgi:hypothetical protein